MCVCASSTPLLCFFFSEQVPPSSPLPSPHPLSSLDALASSSPPPLSRVCHGKLLSPWAEHGPAARAKTKLLHCRRKKCAPLAYKIFFLFWCGPRSAMLTVSLLLFSPLPHLSSSSFSSFSSSSSSPYRLRNGHLTGYLRFRPLPSSPPPAASQCTDKSSGGVPRSSEGGLRAGETSKMAVNLPFLPLILSSLLAYSVSTAASVSGNIGESRLERKATN